VLCFPPSRGPLLCMQQRMAIGGGCLVCMSVFLVVVVDGPATFGGWGRGARCGVVVGSEMRWPLNCERMF
jgi:hypothetical protein